MLNVAGTQKQVDAGLEQIKKRFPPSQYNQVNYTSVNSANEECQMLPPEIMQASSEEARGVGFDLTSLYTAIN